jgi:signal transduction histidine kinase
MSIDTIYARALSLRLRHPAQLAALADELDPPGALGASEPMARARAAQVRAWHQVALHGPKSAGAAVAAALALMRAAGPALQASTEDLQSLHAHASGDAERGLQHGLAALAAQTHPLLPAERCVTLARVASAHTACGRFDEALPFFYRAIDEARATGDTSLLAAMLSIVGGVQYSLSNLEDGIALGEQAWQLIGDREPDQTWGIAAINWIVCQAPQGCPEKAIPVAERFLAHSSAFNIRMQMHSLLAIAAACIDAGLPERARQALAQSAGLAVQPCPEPVAAAWVRAHLLNRDGLHEAALALCRQRLADTANDPPPRLASLYAEGVAAARAQGDLAQALQWQQALGDLERRVNRDAARTRRLTLQIQFELQNAERERDLARAREQAARLEQLRLADANGRLRDTNRAKTRFLAAASHDLRQPLHAMALHMARLQQQQLATDAAQTVQRLDQALDGLTRMFETLLDISRLDAGGLRPQVQPLALRPLLAALTDELAPLAEERGLRLGLRAHHSGGTRSDPALLETLLRNLLANALKYTPQGSVLVALRRAGPHWHVQVRDSGIGIAPDEHEQVFDEFHRSAAARQSGTEGLGLGLSIVRRLSLLLDHGLTLRSAPGRGSCFTLALPVVEGVGEAPAEHAPAADRPTLRVALIEDDAAQREALCALLQSWGHEVLAAEDLAGLLELQASSGPPDALVADYRLQRGRTGLQAVQQLRGDAPALPALVITAESDPQALAALADSGLPWLPKPLKSGQLRSWLASLSARA